MDKPELDEKLLVIEPKEKERIVVVPEENKGSSIAKGDPFNEGSFAVRRALIAARVAAASMAFRTHGIISEGSHGELSESKLDEDYCVV